MLRQATGSKRQDLALRKQHLVPGLERQGWAVGTNPMRIEMQQTQPSAYKISRPACSAVNPALLLTIVATLFTEILGDKEIISGGPHTLDLLSSK